MKVAFAGFTCSEIMPAPATSLPNQVGNTLGYVGNTPNAWDGVPDEVMAKLGVSLKEKYLPLYLKPEDRETIIQRENERNLIG